MLVKKKFEQPLGHNFFFPLIRMYDIFASLVRKHNFDYGI